MARGQIQSSRFSARKSHFTQTIMSDFRYQMSNDPYLPYYLPLLASLDELKYWDVLIKSENCQSRDLFMKSCMLNFDEKVFITLNKYNPEYLTEFKATVEENNVQAKSLLNFVKKLKAYLEYI